MAKLIRPDNNQPAEFICVNRGYICLRTSCITPAVRWFSLAQIEAVNPVATCAEPPPMHIYPMPAMYPQAVFLAAANYYLHTQAMATDEIDSAVIAKSALLIARAVADGQLPVAA